MVYTVTLNPAIDYDIFFDAFKEGTLNVAKSANFRAAGKGINVSKVLHNLSVPTKALGFIGGFTGEFIQQDLISCGIEHQFISVPQTTRINVKLLHRDIETEMNGVPSQICNKDVNKIKNILSNAVKGDYVVFSGSTPIGVNDNIYFELASHLNKDVKTVLDTRGDILAINIYNNLLLKPNLRELEEISGKKLVGDKDIINAGIQLLDKGVEFIIVSMGGEGAYFISQDKCYKACAIKGKVVKTIAAGDSMVAAFIYADTMKMSLKDAFCYAVAAGSATAFSDSIATKNKIDMLFSKVNTVEIF